MGVREENNNSYHLPNKSCGVASNDKSTDCPSASCALHDGSPTPDLTESLLRKSLGINVNPYSGGTRSVWRPPGLSITQCVDDGAVQSHKMSRGLGVRRASHSHSFLVADFINDNDDVCSSFTSNGKLSLDNNGYFRANIMTGQSRECVSFAPLVDDKVIQAMSVPSGHCMPLCVEAEVDSVAASTSAALREEDCVLVGKCHPSNTETKRISAKEIITDFFEGNSLSVSCLRDVLGDTTLLRTSHSFGEVLMSPRRDQQFSRLCNRGVFGLFGTMERGYFGAFAGIFRRYKSVLEPFLERVLQSNQDLYPNEVNMMDFLRGVREAPDKLFFRNPLIAWPVHVLYAVSCFYATAKLHGYNNIFEAIRLRGGLFASGRSFLAALAVAMSSTEEALVYYTAKMYRAAFFVGLLYSKKEERLQRHVKNCMHHSFALLVVNISMSSLQLLLDEVNKVGSVPKSCDDILSGNHASYVIPMSKLEITRVISSRSAVVCGHPLDLERLNIFLVQYVNKTGLGVHAEYLPVTAPENSSIYNQLQHLELLQIWRENRVNMDIPALQLTLYSPVNGESWMSTSTSSLAERIALAATSSLHDLTCSLRHLQNGDILLDFSAAAPCVSELIDWTQMGITVLSQPADCIGGNIFPSPHRSALDGVVRSTLGKCAQINNILQSMQWERKPFRTCVLNLATSFVDLGLLIIVEEFERVSAGVCLKGTQLEASSAKEKAVFDTTIMEGLPNEGPAGFQVNSDERMVAGSVGIKLLCVNSSKGLTDTTMTVQYVVLPNDKQPVAINMYQVLPVTKYHEVQFNCLLTQSAIEFTRRLTHCTGVAFPPYTLLMCPTVLTLIELWDTHDFVKGTLGGFG